MVGFCESGRLITMARGAGLFGDETLMNRYPGIEAGC
jgi:hypothetical protein